MIQLHWTDKEMTQELNTGQPSCTKQRKKRTQPIQWLSKSQSKASIQVLLTRSSLKWQKWIRFTQPKSIIRITTTKTQLKGTVWQWSPQNCRSSKNFSRSISHDFFNPTLYSYLSKTFNLIFWQHISEKKMHWKQKKILFLMLLLSHCLTDNPKSRRK